MIRGQVARGDTSILHTCWRGYLALIARRDSKLGALADEIAATRRERPSAPPIDIYRPDAAARESKMHYQALSSDRRNMRSKTRLAAIKHVATQKTYQTSSRLSGYPS
jgi:hypothetical protein